MLKIVFLNKISAYNCGTCSPEKNRKKIQKNDFRGLCPGLDSVKMYPKIFKKKTCCTNYPGRVYLKKKSAIRPGYYLGGLPVYRNILFIILYALHRVYPPTFYCFKKITKREN